MVFIYQCKRGFKMRCLSTVVSIVIALAVYAPNEIRAQHQIPGEEPVDPYDITNANAGAKPYPDARYFDQFGGKSGIDNMVEAFVARLYANPVIKDVFFAADKVRLTRTLKEQVCYVLGGPCDYTGRPMNSSHDVHGITQREFNALVVDLQLAMNEFDIPFRAQNKLLVKLAPMASDIISR